MRRDNRPTGCTEAASRALVGVPVHSVNQAGCHLPASRDGLSLIFRYVARKATAQRRRGLPTGILWVKLQRYRPLTGWTFYPGGGIDNYRLITWPLSCDDLSNKQLSPTRLAVASASRWWVAVSHHRCGGRRHSFCR